MTEIRVALVAFALIMAAVAGFVGWQSLEAGAVNYGSGGTLLDGDAPAERGMRRFLQATTTTTPTPTSPTPTQDPAEVQSTSTPTSTPVPPNLKVVIRMTLACSWVSEDTVQLAAGWENQHDHNEPGELVGYQIRLKVNGVDSGWLHHLESTDQTEARVLFARGVAAPFTGEFVVNSIYQAHGRNYYGPINSVVCTLATGSNATPTPTPTPSSDQVTVANLQLQCSRHGNDAVQLVASWDAAPATVDAGDLEGYGVNLVVGGQLKSAVSRGVNDLNAYFDYRPIATSQNFSALVQVFAKYRNEDGATSGRPASRSCSLAPEAPVDTQSPASTPPPTHTAAPTATGAHAPAAAETPPAPESLSVQCVRGDPLSDLNITWRAPDAILTTLTFRHYTVEADLSGQAHFATQSLTTSYTRRLQITRPESMPTVTVTVGALYVDQSGAAHRSATVSGQCTFAAADPPATAVPGATTPPGVTPLPSLPIPLSPVPTPGHTPVPGNTPVPDPTPVPAATPLPTRDGSCRGLTVRASRPEPGAVSDLIIETGPPNCVLPSTHHNRAEVWVELPEDLDVPGSFDADDVLIVAGSRYQPAWIDVRDEEDGRTKIQLLNCDSWRVPGRDDVGVCDAVGPVSRVELDNVRLPRRPAGDDEPHRVVMGWDRGGELSGNLTMRATLSVEEEHVDWDGRAFITATGFTPGLTVRFYAMRSGSRVDCDDSLSDDDWDEIDSAGADRRGRTEVEVRVDRAFDAVGEHQICAQDGAGMTAHRSVELVVRPGLELPGGSGLVYTQGDDITIRLLPESANLRVDSVRVDGRHTDDWRQRGSDLELTLPSVSGDDVPVRVEFDDGTVSEVRVSLSERELLVSSLEGLSEPVMLGGRMLLRTSGLAGDQVCHVSFEGIPLAILDDEDRDWDGCVRVGRSGAVELTAAVTTEDGHVTSQLVRAVMSAGDTGEVAVEDDAGVRSSTQARVARPEVSVEIPGEVVAAGDVITVKGKNFPPDRDYLTQPEVRIDYGDRMRHVDYLEPDWVHELTLSERQQAGALVEVHVLIDGYRLPGASARHRVEVSSVRLQATPDTVRMGEPIRFRVSGLPGYVSGYRLQVQNGISLLVDGSLYFTTDAEGGYEGQTELPSDYQDFLLEERRSRVLLQLYHGDRIIPSALATVNISSTVLYTPTPEPVAQPEATPEPGVQPGPSPTPTATRHPEVTPAPTALPAVDPTPGVIRIDLYTSTPTPGAEGTPAPTPFIIMLPAATPEGGDGEGGDREGGDGEAPTPTPLATWEPLATLAPLPTFTPTAAPTPTLLPTLPPPPTRNQEEIAQTITAQVNAQLNRGRDGDADPDADADATDEPTPDPGRDERDDEEDEEEDGMFGLSSRQLTGVVLVALLLVAGAGYYYWRRSRTAAGPQTGPEPEQGSMAEFMAQQAAAQQAAEAEAAAQQAAASPPDEPVNAYGAEPGPVPGNPYPGAAPPPDEPVNAYGAEPGPVNPYPGAAAPDAAAPGHSEAGEAGEHQGDDPSGALLGDDLGDWPMGGGEGLGQPPDVR